jgi:hypothetical protein
VDVLGNLGAMLLRPMIDDVLQVALCAAVEPDFQAHGL